MKTMIVALALAAFWSLVGWYLIDGRYTYLLPLPGNERLHGTVLRVDRLTGMTAYCVGERGCLPILVDWQGVERVAKKGERE